MKGFTKPEQPKPKPRADGRPRIGDMVVHKSSQLLAFNKPAGLAVQTAREDQPSLQAMASAYAKRDLYLLHRIDQPASGLVLFGRHRAKAGQLQQQFAKGTAERTYLAIVEGEPTAEPGELTHWLGHDARNNKAFVAEEEREGVKAAKLSWRIVGETDRYKVVEVQLSTGRPHQVRAQLAAIGLPIHGDVKYGARRANANRSIHLHSWRLTVQHPVSGQPIALVAPVPKEDALWQAVGELSGPA